MTGPVYMRLLRGNVPLVLDEYDYKFELGKAKLLRDGKDVLIISSGLHDHARAGSGQAAARPTASMSACCTCRPSSRSTSETILREAGAAGRLVVVAENHTVIGGLGEAVAGAAAALRRHPDLPPDRAARRVPRRRRAADPARPLRHLDRGHGPQHQGLAGAVAGQSAVGRIRRACSASSRHAPTSRCGPWRAALQCWKREDTMADGRSASGQSASGRSASPQLSRRRLLAGAAAVPLCGILTHGARGGRVRATSSPPGQDPTHPVNIRAQEALDRIREATGGRLDIKLFPANQLGSDTDLLSQVRNGSVEFFNQSSSILVDFRAGGGHRQHRLRLHRLRRGVEGDGRRPRHLRPRADRQDADHDRVAGLGQRLPPDHLVDRARSGRRTTSRASRSACRRRRC